MAKKLKEPTLEDIERGESTGNKKFDDRIQRIADKEFGKKKEEVRPEKKAEKEEKKIKKEKDKKKPIEKGGKKKKPREPIVAGGECPWSSFRAMIDDLWLKHKKKVTFAMVEKHLKKYFKGKKYTESQLSASIRKREKHGICAKRDLKRIKK